MHFMDNTVEAKDGIRYGITIIVFVVFVIPDLYTVKALCFSMN